MEYFDRFLKRTSVFKKVFNTSEGKEVLKLLAEEAGQFKTSYAQGDSHAMAFNEGKRYMFNHIMAIVGQDEDLIRKQIQYEQDQLHLRSTL